MDTRMRSLLKSASWRLVATGFTFGFSYLWLQDISGALGLALAVNAVKSGAYYLHERAWNAFTWGQYPRSQHNAARRPEPLSMWNSSTDTNEDAGSGIRPKVEARLP